MKRKLKLVVRSKIQIIRTKLSPPLKFKVSKYEMIPSRCKNPTKSSTLIFLPSLKRKIHGSCFKRKKINGLFLLNRQTI